MNRAVRRLMGCGGALCLSIGFAVSPAWGQREMPNEASLNLANREYRWASHTAIPGDIEIVISLPEQRMFVYRGGTLIGASSVSTGTRRKATPTGQFEILEKNLFHRSNLYSNAPMPFMQRLTWDGIAIHAGDLPGYAASHGCIRLPRDFARRLFDMTDVGAAVLVTNQSLPEPGAPPPRLHAAVTEYESERYAIVTDDRNVYAAEGRTIFAPSRAVVQAVDPKR